MSDESWTISSGELETIVNFKDLLGCLSASFINANLSNIIPRLVDEADNVVISVMPNAYDVRVVVFSLGKDSVASPDGFKGCFFKTYYDIINHDLSLTILTFFISEPLPKTWSATNFILLQKKGNPKTCFDFVPSVFVISLKK